MNFHDKRVKKLISILIILLIAAMVGTAVLPFVIG